jgi:serine/threonine protein kinase/tetratricopeptide (TPR) repeat protein
MTGHPGEPQDARIVLDGWFERALDLEGQAREALIRQLEAEAPDLAIELRQLLALTDEGCDRLVPRDPGGARWQALFESTPVRTTEPSLASEIGVWRPLRLIGRGGMGTVHLAERFEGGFRQQGALKLLHGDVDSDDFLQRFAQERQILASLNHPGIARLLDGGRDDRGRPYLVMEYIEGEPLDRYCDARRLDIAQRIGLFVQVANAIAHAHRNLIAHRDLKPTNILVTEDGTVKLLDFGIAKVLSDDAVGTQPLTRTAMRMFTPEYATPEQVLGETAAAAADIYQLGLLLYELLTGHRAQRVQGLTQRALEEAICRTLPITPSARIGAEDGALCALRDTTPAALRRQLRGDLDNIVLMALRKEPERRYASASDLADDLDRWRRALPIRARPDTFRYITGKFVRRHALIVGASTTIALLLVGYAITATLQSRALAQERDRARAEAVKAQQVKALVLQLFEGADPEANGGAHMSARELLDRGWMTIEPELQGQPDVQAEVLDTVGEAYRKLGEYKRAQALLDQSLRIARALPSSPAGTTALARALRSRGRLHSDAGDAANAERLLLEALALQRATKPQPVLDITETLSSLGHAAFANGDYATAETRFSESLGIRRELLGSDHALFAANLANLGNVRQQQARYPQARDLHAQALAIYRKRLPPTHPHVAGGLSNLAKARFSLGDSAEAERLYREALALLQEAFGESHPNVAMVKNNLANVLLNRRDLVGARTLLEDALRIREAALGPRHPMVALNMNDLGKLAFDNDDLASAERWYRQALDAYAPDHHWRSATVFNLAFAHEKKGELAAAERGYREAFEAQRREYGPEHDRAGMCLLRLGVVLHKQGRLDEAEASLRQAMEIMRKRMEAGHPRRALASLSLGQLLLDRGQPDAAAPLIREALSIRRKAYGEQDRRTREALAAVQKLPRHLR